MKIGEIDPRRARERKRWTAPRFEDRHGTRKHAWTNLDNQSPHPRALVAIATFRTEGAASTVIESTVDPSHIESGTPRTGLAKQPMSIRMSVDGADLVHPLQLIGPL